MEPFVSALDLKVTFLRYNKNDAFCALLVLHMQRSGMTFPFVHFQMYIPWHAYHNYIITYRSYIACCVVMPNIKYLQILGRLFRALNNMSAKMNTCTSSIVRQLSGLVAVTIFSRNSKQRNPSLCCNSIATNFCKWQEHVLVITLWEFE